MTLPPETSKTSQDCHPECQSTHSPPKSMKIRFPPTQSAFPPTQFVFAPTQSAPNHPAHPTRLQNPLPEGAMENSPGQAQRSPGKATPEIPSPVGATELQRQFPIHSSYRRAGQPEPCSPGYSFSSPHLQIIPHPKRTMVLNSTARQRTTHAPTPCRDPHKPNSRNKKQAHFSPAKRQRHTETTQNQTSPAARSTETPRTSPVEPRSRNPANPAQHQQFSPQPGQLHHPR
jgi:hypothetical protein